MSCWECVCLNSVAALGQAGRLQASMVLRSGGCTHAAATCIVNRAFNSWTHSSFRILMPPPHVTEHSLHGSARQLATFPILQKYEMKVVYMNRSLRRVQFAPELPFLSFQLRITSESIFIQQSRIAKFWIFRLEICDKNLLWNKELTGDEIL